MFADFDEAAQAYYIKLESVSTLGLGKIASDLADWKSRATSRRRRSGLHSDHEAIAFVDCLLAMIRGEAAERDRNTAQNRGAS